jgi:phage tail tube protein FII
MANQTFKVAGITVHNSNAKVRFTDDMVRRVKQFSKGGATRIDLIELPSEMTKVEALTYLSTHATFQSAEDQATISDALADRVKESNKGEIKVKKAKPSLANIKSRAKKQVTAEQVLAEVGVA